MPVYPITLSDIIKRYEFLIPTQYRTSNIRNKLLFICGVALGGPELFAAVQCSMNRNDTFSGQGGTDKTLKEFIE
jgi:hypothetical protein